MILDRKLVSIVLVCLALGWWLGSSPSSPINPTPQRPIIQKLSRVAILAARGWLCLPSLHRRPTAGSSFTHRRLMPRGIGWLTTGRAGDESLDHRPTVGP
jgi:hypothetical protein